MIAKTLAERFNAFGEWAIERGDPSVGIFGEDYWHDACSVDEPTSDSMSQNPVVLTSWYSGEGSNRMGHWVNRVVCPDCGQVALFVESIYDPGDEYFVEPCAECGQAPCVENLRG